jgi:hypothetical protein
MVSGSRHKRALREDTMKKPNSPVGRVSRRTFMKTSAAAALASAVAAPIPAGLHMPARTILTG